MRIHIIVNVKPCTVYSKKYAHGFCFAVLCCGYTLTDFPISIRLTSLALWQSNECPSASKATLMNMVGNFISNKLHYRQIQTRTIQTLHICNLLVVTRKDLRLIELATNHDVKWPKCDSPLTSSILIPSWVLDHSFIYLTFDVLCCTISYYLFKHKLYIIIFRNVILSYFPFQAWLAFIFLQIIF